MGYPEMVTLIVVAALQAFTAWLTWRSHNLTAETKNIALATQHNVAIIEKATNSLTDRLVATTGREQRAEGVIQGKAEGKIEEAAKDKRPR